MTPGEKRRTLYLPPGQPDAPYAVTAVFSATTMTTLHPNPHADLIASASRAINNVLAEPEMARVLARYGYTEATLNRLKSELVILFLSPETASPALTRLRLWLRRFQRDACAALAHRPDWLERIGLCG